MMTRKDHERIADVLAAEVREFGESPASARITAALAAALSADNPKFIPFRFYQVALVGTGLRQK